MGKFIIRIKEWCIYWVEGSLDELKAKLGELGIKVVGDEPIDFVSLGLHFGKRIKTECRCIGYDSDFVSRVKTAMRKAVLEIDSNIADEFDAFLVSNASELRWLGENREVMCNDIDILAMDYEMPKRPNVICMTRDYKPMDTIDGSNLNDYIKRFANKQLVL